VPQSGGLFPFLVLEWKKNQIIIKRKFIHVHTDINGKSRSMFWSRLCVHFRMYIIHGGGLMSMQKVTWIGTGSTFEFGGFFFVFFFVALPAILCIYVNFIVWRLNCEVIKVIMAMAVSQVKNLGEIQELCALIILNHGITRSRTEDGRRRNKDSRREHCLKLINSVKTGKILYSYSLSEKSI
jgi:hypothetical protein